MRVLHVTPYFPPASPYGGPPASVLGLCQGLQRAGVDVYRVTAPLTVPGWVLRRVYDGAALIEGRDGIVEVEPGMVTPGLGRVEAIKRQDGRWVVVTSRGLIVGR